MRIKFPIRVFTKDGLFQLVDRVQYAIESTTRIELDPPASRRITARLLGERSWDSAIRSVTHRESAIKATMAMEYFLSAALPRELMAFSLCRYVHGENAFASIDAYIEPALNLAFTSHYRLFLNTRALISFDYLNLIYNANPSSAQELFSVMHLPENAYQVIAPKAHCSVCQNRLGAFGRCFTDSCEHRLAYPATQISPVDPIGPLHCEVELAGGGLIKLDAAPLVEQLIIKTCRAHKLPHHLDANGRLHTAYNGLIETIYGIQGVHSVHVDPQELGHKTRDLKRQARTVIALPGSE